MLASAFAGQTIVRRGVLPPASGRAALVIQNASKKGAGSTKNGRDSISKRRGVKVFGGQHVKAGGIIIRQLGTTVRLRLQCHARFQMITRRAC